jgi:hypothetical protein
MHSLTQFAETLYPQKNIETLVITSIRTLAFARWRYKQRDAITSAVEQSNQLLRVCHFDSSVLTTGSTFFYVFIFLK